MTRVTLVRVLLTITALEFFGPIVRDSGADHLLHPDWPGHARVHLVWLLGFMGFSGLANLYLVWLRPPHDVANLRLSAAWQCCNLGGFWVAYLLEQRYGGEIAVPGSHLHFLGMDENVFVFAVLSVLMGVALVLLRGLHAPR